jgi:hypothetical protein
MRSRLTVICGTSCARVASAVTREASDLRLASILTVDSIAMHLVRCAHSADRSTYPSFASIVIFALSTFETGHPDFALSAAVLNAS